MSRVILMCGLLPMIVSCGGGPAAPAPPGGVVGDYTLRTIDGASLPFATVSNASVRLTVLSGAFNLASGGSTSGEVSSRFEVLGASSQTSVTPFSGTYAVAGTSFSMTTVSVNNGVSSPSTTFTGTINGNGRIVLTWSDGHSYVYQR